MNKHVADDNEVRTLLPAFLQNAGDGVHEYVWEVDERTGQIESGSCVNTWNSTYFDFIIERVNGRMVAIKAVSFWRPCADD